MHTKTIPQVYLMIVRLTIYREVNAFKRTWDGTSRKIVLTSRSVGWPICCGKPAGKKRVAFVLIESHELNTCFLLGPKPAATRIVPQGTPHAPLPTATTRSQSLTFAFFSPFSDKIWLKFHGRCARSATSLTI